MNKIQAVHVAKVFSDYFDNFDTISEYMRDQKIDFIKDYGASLPGMGPEEDLFDDFTMSPQDMDISIQVLPMKVFVRLLDIVSTHVNRHSVPGRTLLLGVKETNTDKWIGFIRFGSPVINMKPRNELLGSVFSQSEHGAKSFNNAAIMGFTIVPSQPFGFNCLGGKLLTGICCSHEIRKMLNDKYDMNLCLFETTSLYGTTKSSSQYDGMKPFIRFKGLTDSNFLPMLNGKPFNDLKTFIENIYDGPIIDPTATSIKLKFSQKVISLTKKALRDTPEGSAFEHTIEKAGNLTERKRYYVSNYGIQNYIDIVNGKTDKIIKMENFDRFYQKHIIEWWKKKATKRFENLKADGRLRTELEVWTRNQKIDIIR